MQVNGWSTPGKEGASEVASNATYHKTQASQFGITPPHMCVTLSYPAAWVSEKLFGAVEEHVLSQPS